MIDRRRLIAMLLILLGGFGTAWTGAEGQMNTAELAGDVSDPSGARIAGASITVLEETTGEKLSTVTDRTGRFDLPQLPVGEFTMTVQATGFSEYKAEHLVLRVNDHDHQSIVLAIGSRGETTEVVTLVTGIQSASPSIKEVLGEKQITELPLKARQMLQLTVLSEGVVNPPGGTRGDSLQQSGSLINVFGQRTGHNLFLLNGTNITDEYYNNVVVNPSVDSVQQFILNKTSYEAEFGGKSGALLNVVTRSGTNHLHGSDFEFFRNNLLDARNYFATAAAGSPAYHQSQFGAALGGPIVRNRLFFFASYEGLRLRQDLAHLFTVATAQQRLGKLGSSSVSGPLDPVAVALLSPVYTPLPNLPGASNNLLQDSPQQQHFDQYSAKVDGTLGASDYAFIFGNLFDARERDPYGSAVLNEAQLPGFGRLLRTHAIDLAVGESHTFSPRVTNDFRFGWLRVSGGQQDPNAGNQFAAMYGLQGTTANRADQGFPQINLSGQFSTLGSPSGFASRLDNHFDFFDNVIVQGGNHHVRFGVYAFHFNFQPRYPNNARGIYTYTGAYTGTPLGDFLKGEPASAQAGLGEGAETATTDWIQAYVQDRWQAIPSITINAGLRYEYNRNLSAAPNQTSDIDLNASGGPAFVVSGNPATLPATAAFNASLSPIPIISNAQVGWDPSLLTPRPVRFSPRIGIDWRAPGNSAAVRASYGVYTNQASYSILQNLAENMPFYLNETVTAPAALNPAYSTESILSPAHYKVPGSIGANSVDHTFRVEYNQVYTLDVEKALPASTVLDLEYVGSRTIHADSSTTVNMPPLPPAGTTSSVAARRPYPQLSAFTTIRWNGWANFNSVTVKGTRSFVAGIYFLTSYTLSKSLDDASDAGATNNEYNLPQNEYAPQLEAGPSSFDHRHRVTAAATWDVPFANGASDWVRGAFAGWRASGIFIAQSGAPFTVNLSTAAGNEPADVGLVNATTNVERPNVTGNPNHGPHTASEWFDTAAFSMPAPFTFGNASRNMVLGPRYVDLDLSLQKSFTVVREDRLEFHFDVFNSLNHPNFNLPGRIATFTSAGVQTTPTFGAITTAQDARDLQFGLKFLF